MIIVRSHKPPPQSGSKTQVSKILAVISDNFETVRDRMLVNIMWNPQDGRRLSLREWELSLPRLGVAPEVVADDEWAVPQG